jgi:hypothetical protein
VAYEKRLKAVPSQLFTADGTNLGKISIPDACAFKVKQQVVLSSSTQGPLRLEVKRVDNDFVLFVGPIGDHQHKASILDRTDISAYLVADGASIFAEEQKRPNIPEQEIERLTYEEEPTVARRTVLVDPCGDKIDSVEGEDGINRLAVDAAISVVVPDLKIDYPTNIVVFNEPVAVANTQVVHTLSATCRRFAIKVRDGKSALNVGFVTGSVLLGPYFKVNRGVVFDSSDLDLTPPFNVYYSSEQSGVVVEFIEWLL